MPWDILSEDTSPLKGTLTGHLNRAIVEISPMVVMADGKESRKAT